MLLKVLFNKKVALYTFIFSLFFFILCVTQYSSIFFTVFDTNSIVFHISDFNNTGEGVINDFYKGFI